MVMLEDKFPVRTMCRVYEITRTVIQGQGHDCHNDFADKVKQDLNLREMFTCNGPTQ